MSEPTPMMKQYLALKEKHKDCLLFFRLGDFYEMFAEDAITASEELNLTLTSRDRGKPQEERTPMCGVPYHAAESYIGRLIARGYRVAICEQTEDPALAKGLVDREVVRIVTPGAVMESSMLDETKNNYIVGIHVSDAGAGLCFSDLSTGELFLTAISGNWQDHAINELSRFSPKEAVLSEFALTPKISAFLKDSLNCCFVLADEAQFSSDETLALAKKQFPDTTAGDEASYALGGLLSYLYQTQKTNLSHLRTLHYYASGEYMELDPAARRNLELTGSLRNNEKRGSLLWVLDHTGTSMGSRLLRGWLERPLLSPRTIAERQNGVREFVDTPILRAESIHALRGIPDLERLIGRIVYGVSGARDLSALAGGLLQIPNVKELLAPCSADLLRKLHDDLDCLPDLCDLISRGIADDPPVSVREGGMIRAGYNPDVDHLRDILAHSREMIAAVETREKEKTGIKSLKIGYNKVFGYYLEISKSYYDQVPTSYIRKQTLSNCERYITQELKDLEHTILSAKDRLTDLEYQLFCTLREQAATAVTRIQGTAAAIAQLDVLTCFAAVAVANHYCMPEVDLSDHLDIREGRHPVVEKMLKDSLFVPNDTSMDSSHHFASIITGPNMAGKSTYMRQVALIVLMAQIGSFVPATSARIGIIDRVFTRIGASDDLAGGQSTFMVEMTEVAALLQNATAKSLLILDEIGRGTSTYDGMSIARAVLDACADRKRLGAKTLFATHYHELTCLEGLLPGVLNFHIAAKKRNGDVVFLRKILPGGADQSYGIEVAKLAGVPAPVIRRARKILAELEAGEHGTPQFASDSDQVSFLQIGEREVLAQLRELVPESLTPMEAINLLYEFKQKLQV
ncbi:MAG: DNA mismatch repair protein MutS [Evtepia sp.]